MDTKGISQRAQQEENDKQEENIRIKSFRIGWFSVTAVMVFLLALRIVYAEPSNDFFMIIVAHLGATSFYEYYNMRDRKIYLFAGIISVILFFLGLATLLRQYGVY